MLMAMNRPSDGASLGVFKDLSKEDNSLSQDATTLGMANFPPELGAVLMGKRSDLPQELTKLIHAQPGLAQFGPELGAVLWGKRSTDATSSKGQTSGVSNTFSQFFFKDFFT